MVLLIWTSAPLPASPLDTPIASTLHALAGVSSSAGRNSPHHSQAKLKCPSMKSSPLGLCPCKGSLQGPPVSPAGCATLFPVLPSAVLQSSQTVKFIFARGQQITALEPDLAHCLLV